MTSSDDRPTEHLASVAPGRVLAGRYELRSTLGSGGMAIVFRARDQVLDRDVAVKVLRDQYAMDPVFLARFTSEALNASRMSHPGLVTIFDAGVDRGTAFIVMEVVGGRTLRQVLTSEGTLAVARSVTIGADVLAVLDVAHRAGVVHRDIKPGNILISDDGTTRVFDFGIARTDGSDALTQTATVIGTAAYLSPEQAEGRSAGPRSDLYAVGCVLMEMLTGSPPFSADTPMALLHQHVNAEPTPPSAQRPEVSGALDAIVLRLLAKDPADRPATAADARRELLSTLNTAKNDTLSLPTTPHAAVPRRRRLTPVRAAVVAVVVLVVLVAAVALGQLVSRQSHRPAVTGSPADSLSPSSTRPAVTPTATPSPTVSPPLDVPTASTVPGALRVLRQVVADGQGAGWIDSSAATQLLTATDGVEAALKEEKGKSAIPQVRRLTDLVDALAGNGQIAANAVQPLNAAVSQLLQVAERAL